ncbi:MAG: hypothetical protein AAB453_04720 [Patescibacteria group bacterium]
MAKTEGLSTRNKVTRVILTSLALGGLLAVATIIPNALKLLGPYVSKSNRVLYNRRGYIKSTISKLSGRGLIEFKKNKDGKTYAKLTAKGQHELLKYRLEELIINKPLRWDKKWRVVMFDIKEFRHHERDQLRIELSGLGFVRLQNSVWVYPYECDEFITLLKTYYGFGKSLLYLVVEKLENDTWLKEVFEL